jgi:V8-like Glu-specific endopeptidase
MEVILRNIFLASLLMMTMTAGHASSKLYLVETTKFGPLDINQLHAEDVAQEKLGRAPRFAVVHHVNIEPTRMSNWVVRGSQLVWQHKIYAQSAASINLAFEKFNLPSSAQLNFFSTDMQHMIRAFTSNDNNSAQQLWTPVIESEEVMVELVVDRAEFDQVELALTRVNQGYRTFAQTTKKAGSCNVDVACKQSQGWENEINTVAVISTGGSTFCTGFMVNNTRNDKTPYFMTADHCGVGNESDAASLVTYWNYQASSCRGARNGRTTDFNTGAQYLASSARSDFTLLKLNQEPSPAYNVRYAGWDRTGVNAKKAIAIHHPATDEKSISFENDPTTNTYYLETELVSDATHVRVENWDLGTTEPGSSGSPLFDQNHRVIGQLHGGYASCTSKTADWYGRLHVSWEGEGSSSTRLKDHLDPDNTGLEVVDTL